VDDLVIVTALRADRRQPLRHPVALLGDVMVVEKGFALGGKSHAIFCDLSRPAALPGEVAAFADGAHGELTAFNGCQRTFWSWLVFLCSHDGWTVLDGTCDTNGGDCSSTNDHQPGVSCGSHQA
jgi:hypothetical protein